ncbi:MAG: Uma2 family endonuclease [Planctomycetes bacterium]|nr:Uma2 family endonuclease [Planctomycetota bacterium]
MQSPPTTADQLLAIDEPGFRHELVGGELRRMSPAGYWHGAVAARLGELLGRHVREHGLGVTFGAETGFLLASDPDTVRAPDTAFVRESRRPPRGTGFFPGPPDLAVEVTSPNGSFASVHDKALCWLEHGAILVWVVELQHRTVTVYRSRDRIHVLGPQDRLTGEDLVPGFAVTVADLFPLDR